MAAGTPDRWVSREGWDGGDVIRCRSAVGSHTVLAGMDGPSELPCSNAYLRRTAGVNWQ